MKAECIRALHMAEKENTWHPPPPELTLSRDEVHIWRASLDRPADEIDWLATTLSPDERQRAERFYFDRDRRRFTAARGTLRTLLSRYIQTEPNKLKFCYGARGKPALASTGSEGKLCFNLSHSESLAVYAVTRDRSIGIDLEYLREMRDAEAIAASFFSPRESAAIRALGGDRKQQAFFCAWTRKEAYLKAIGDGLAKPLNQVEVSLTPEEPARLHSVAGDAQQASRWELLHLTPAPGYVGAVAIEGHNFSLSYWQWDFASSGTS